MGFSGLYIEEQSSIALCLSQEGLGGVLLFDYDLLHKKPGKNLVNREQIRQLTEQINDYAEGIPPFIAIDYEGGAVDRLSQIQGCHKTKKVSELAEMDDESLHQELVEMAETLQGLGFNLNFAPVVDLGLNNKEGIIAKLGRSFSADPVEVARFATRFVKVFADHGISCCYKHFPGHGSAIGDTHQGFVDVTETFQEKELEPYTQLLANKESSTMIMTAHVINHKLDPSGLPATLSRPILSGLLREQLGFDGVIISDDLQMHAIAHHFSVDEALCRTINAGADMLIFANQLGEISASEVIDRIERLVGEGQIEENRIRQAYQRIVKMKQRHLTEKRIYV
jgi:beta-N-acetylhexosaminidase